jgi:hypothetical protein
MWMHDYVKRAQKLANQSPFAPGHVAEWNALEDDLLGKLTIAQLSRLRDYCMEMNGMGSGVILSMIGTED